MSKSVCNLCQERIGKFEKNVVLDGVHFHHGCSLRYARAKEERESAPTKIRRYYLPRNYGR